MFFRKLAKHGKVLIQLTDEVFLGAPLIAVNAYHTNAVIARITLQVFLIGQVRSHTRRVSPQQVVETVGIQLVLQHVPQGLILFSST